MQRQHINIILRGIGTLLAMLWLQSSYAQTAHHSNEVRFQLIPLPQLIDSAFTQSPAIRKLDRQIEIDRGQLALQRNAWTKFFTVNGVVSYGNLSSFWNTEYQDGINSAQLNTSRDLRYSTSLTFRMPLYDIMSMKETRRVARIQYEQSLDEHDILRREIARAITTQYHHVRYCQRRLEIASSGKESANLYMQMAERQFLEGAIKVGELAHVTDSHNKVLNEYEEAKTALIDAYMQLELMAGISLQHMP